MVDQCFLDINQFIHYQCIGSDYRFCCTEVHIQLTHHCLCRPFSPKNVFLSICFDFCCWCLDTRHFPGMSKNVKSNVNIHVSIVAPTRKQKPEFTDGEYFRRFLFCQLKFFQQIGQKSATLQVLICISQSSH